ncbi:MAG: hypothetical protein LLG37_05090 [Spirochaetia bacterium]|nr:hypothetical protein [Spirochaetia bacterium]
MDNKKFLFATLDGYTEDMQGIETQNCQILGCASGRNIREAFLKLRAEDESLADRKFETVFVYEVVSFEEQFV